jgi:hypothetical protein
MVRSIINLLLALKLYIDQWNELLTISGWFSYWIMPLYSFVSYFSHKTVNTFFITEYFASVNRAERRNYRTDLSVSRCITLATAGTGEPYRLSPEGWWRNDWEVRLTYWSSCVKLIGLWTLWNVWGRPVHLWAVWNDWETSRETFCEPYTRFWKRVRL